MKNKILFTLRLAHYVAIVIALALGVGEVLSLIRLDPLTRVRSISASLEQDTVPTKSRIVYRELVGYFPLPPSSVWEFESEKNWNDYRTTVRKDLGAGFRVVADNDSFHCVKRFGDEIQYLDVELLSDKPLRVRCELMLVRDSSD